MGYQAALVHNFLALEFFSFTTSALSAMMSWLSWFPLALVDLLLVLVGGKFHDFVRCSNHILNTWTLVMKLLLARDVVNNGVWIGGTWKETEYHWWSTGGDVGHGGRSMVSLLSAFDGTTLVLTKKSA